MSSQLYKFPEDIELIHDNLLYLLIALPLNLLNRPHIAYLTLHLPVC